MSTPAPTPATASRPAALTAFLRGVERRAAVLAELQSGDARRGDAAVRRALDAVADEASTHPMADWPRRFWRALLGDPALAATGPARFVPAASPAVRAAVLLRLAAGLDESEAADVLGVEPARIRDALGHAVPRDADGAPDAALWRQWQAEIQRRVRDLPAPRVAALSDAARADAMATKAAPRRFPPRRAAAVAAAATGLALLATFVVDRYVDRPIRAVALPPAGEPASRFSSEAGLIAHPDFDRLADPDQARLADEAAFLAWTLGHAATPADTAPVPVDDAAIPDSSEAADAP